jgi:photosystem II stability/assembly factor-like uncharacterized protein
VPDSYDMHRQLSASTKASSTAARLHTQHVLAVVCGRASQRPDVIVVEDMMVQAAHGQSRTVKACTTACAHSYVIGDDISVVASDYVKRAWLRAG